MSKQSLGKLERVDLREYWRDEARDFTPWVASKEGLGLLGETIGMELELVAQETFVGPFKADILARETGEDEQRYIVIENQLEKTNHDHLGKIITYSAGLGAITMIWIAETFSEEHRQALDWLNANTREDLAFYGLQIELWQIGNSDPAPQFEIISSPNESANSAKSATKSSERNERDLEQLRFWQELQAYAKGLKSQLFNKKARRGRAYYITVGRRGFTIVLVVLDSKQRIECKLNIEGQQAQSALALLEKDKVSIEAEIGSQLDWHRSERTRRCSIIGRKEDVTLDVPEQSEIAKKWFFEVAQKFYNAFAHRVKTLDMGEIEDEGSDETATDEAEEA